MARAASAVIGVIGVTVAVALAVAGCSRAGSAPPAPGTERGACYGNGTCNDGLTCLSDRCVDASGTGGGSGKRLGSGSGSGSGTGSGTGATVRPGMADCAEVAEALVSLELGNYAPRDQRAGRASDIATLCRAQFVTRAEAECLLSKTRKDDLAECPKPLVVKPLTEAEKAARKAASGMPRECDDYVAAVERYAACSSLPADARKAMRDAVAQMKQGWQQSLGAQSDPSARKLMGDACKQGGDAIRQAMAQLGC